MKKIAFEKKEYLKPEILSIIAKEGEMMQQLSAWDQETPESGTSPTPGGSIIQDPTSGSGEGYLRTFFDTLKAGTSSSIARLFVTGVRQAAIEQVKRYAESEVVTSSVKTTTLHKLVVIYRGTEMVVCEEIQ